MAVTANGHQVIIKNRTTGDHPRLRKWIIPGTSRHLLLRDGCMGFILVHVALWFDESIEQLDRKGEVWDEWGWAVRPVRGQTTGYSNHAGGAAEDLNATKHPRGVPVSDTMSKAKIKAIRRRMKWYGGVVIWGGGWKTPDGMHFEIAKVSHKRMVLLARSLKLTPRGRRIMKANPDAKGLLKY